MSQQILDQYIQRFENLPPFWISHLSQDGNDAVPWMEVRVEYVCRELVFDELNTAVQIDTISANIEKWSRLEALTNRVWQLRERQLRTWKASFIVDLYDNADGKKPAEWVSRERYRADPRYTELSLEVEKAEEAYNATRGIVTAFRAQKDVIEKFARRTV